MNSLFLLFFCFEKECSLTFFRFLFLKNFLFILHSLHFRVFLIFRVFFLFCLAIWICPLYFFIINLSKSSVFFLIVFIDQAPERLPVPFHVGVQQRLSPPASTGIWICLYHLEKHLKKFFFKFKTKKLIFFLYQIFFLTFKKLHQNYNSRTVETFFLNSKFLLLTKFKKSRLASGDRCNLEEKQIYNKKSKFWNF